MDIEYIYKIVKQIPYGKVTSYGAIAEALGYRGAARLVGYAMNKSHLDPSIPAHRVVNRNGLLTGRHHFTTPTLMAELLTGEGLKIENNKIIDFKKFFWDPREIQL